MNNLEWLKKNCTDLLEEIIVPHLDEWLLEHKNIHFKREDILQNDIAKHIILEWIKEDNTFLKNILIGNLSLKNGVPFICNRTYCGGCDFIAHCNAEDMRVWFEEEHKPSYKKGDILITKEGEIVIVAKVNNKNLVVSRNINNAKSDMGWYVLFDEIERKIGNVYD